jgi:CRP/FNR family cyclic AMP-dependent transcriptional regulator
MNVKRLQEIPLFAGLDESLVEAVTARAEEHSIPEGKALVRQGEYSPEMTIIDEGTARVEIDGSEVASLGPGDVFGEAGLLHNEMRNATVTATSDMRIITVSDFDLRRIKGEHPQFVERLEQLAQQRAG